MEGGGDREGTVNGGPTIEDLSRIADDRRVLDAGCVRGIRERAIGKVRKGDAAGRVEEAAGDSQPRG